MNAVKTRGKTRTVTNGCHSYHVNSAGCPSSSTKCGNVCINPANQCCKTTSAVGLQCSAPFTACSADGGTCGTSSSWPKQTYYTQVGVGLHLGVTWNATVSCRPHTAALQAALRAKLSAATFASTPPPSAASAGPTRGKRVRQALPAPQMEARATLLQQVSNCTGSAKSATVEATVAVQ